MKIIKQGLEKRIKETKRFECSHCGCIFDADKGEYETGNKYNEIYHYCKCPFCGKNVTRDARETGRIAGRIAGGDLAQENLMSAT